MRAATRAGVGSCPNLITASSAPNETERDKQKRKKRRDANRSGRLRRSHVRQINLSCRPRATTNDKGKLAVSPHSRNLPHGVGRVRKLPAN